jgi:hypothetical protein
LGDVFKVSYWPKYVDENLTPLLFIHIPKTAGLSIQQWYRNTYGKFVKCMHGSAAHPVVADINTRIESFCVVRNPYDLVYSWYRYKRQMLDETRHRDPKELAAWERGFDYWLQHYFEKVNYTTDKTREGEFNPISPSFTQLSYMRDPNGKLNVNYTLRFETLSQDFELIKNLSKSQYDLGFTNKTAVANRDYRTVYTVQSRRLVDSVYKEDLDFFNYDF